MKKHIDGVHNGKKDHNCDSCGKSFSQAEDLKRHIYSVHNGKKDYKCDSCGKEFSLTANLKKHSYTVHNDQKYHKCESCGKTFSQSGSLKVRINSVHKVIIRDKKITNVTCGKLSFTKAFYSVFIFSYIFQKRLCLFKGPKKDILNKLTSLD